MAWFDPSTDTDNSDSSAPPVLVDAANSIVGQPLNILKATILQRRRRWRGSQPLADATGSSSTDSASTQVGSGSDGGSSGSAGVSSSGRSPVSKGTPAESGVAPSAEDVNSGYGASAPPDSVNNPPVQFPQLAEQGPKNPFLRVLSRITGMTKGSPEPGQQYTGPIGEDQKLGALKKFVGNLGDGLEGIGSGNSPQERIARMELPVQERQAAAQREMARAQLESLNEWRQGQLPIKQQQADTAQDLAQARAPLYGAQAGLAQARDAKTQLETEQMQQGMFPVDPVTAQLVNRPDLAGKAIPAVLWRGLVSGPLAARGFHPVDLGSDGYWMIDRAGNKVHQISAASPSVSRAQAYGANRPVQAIDPETGNVQWMPAGRAEAQGAAPAGAGMQVMSKQAQFRDIEIASQNLRDAIRHLGDEELSPDQIAKLTMATRSTNPTILNQLKDSLFGTQQLTPTQQNLVVWLAQLQERAMSLRSIAGMGQGSDMLRAAIETTLPSVKSGRADLMFKQLDAFDNQVAALRAGLPNVAGPTPIHAAASSAKNGGGSVRMIAPDGTTKTVPANQVEHYKKLGAKVKQ